MKRRFVRVMSTVLAGVIVFSMGMSAWATEGLKEVTEVKFTKSITTDGNTYAPNTSFAFVITAGNAVSGTDIKAGVAGGLTVDYSNIKFDPKKDAFSDTYSKDGTLSVDKDKFQAPGVYHYTIKEKIPETPYSGMKYDERVYDVYVTILNTADSKGLYCAGIHTPKLDDDGNPVLDEEGKMVKADSLVFTNDYGAAVDIDSTHEVTVTKKVTGNLADMNQAFEFVIKVKADETGEIFKYVTTDAVATTGSIAGDESEVTVSLKNGESVTIYGLTAGDVVDVHESDIYASEYGYKVTREFTEGVEMVDGNEDTDGFTAKITKDSSKVVIENNKNAGAATGLALSFGPYVLMVGLAVVFAVMFLRKKNEIDEI